MAQALSRLLGGGPLRPPTPQDATSNRIMIARRGLRICLSLSFICFCASLTQMTARGSPQLHDLRDGHAAGLRDCCDKVHRLFLWFLVPVLDKQPLKPLSCADRGCIMMLK